jgi:hypothetical protein
MRWLASWRELRDTGTTFEVGQRQVVFDVLEGIVLVRFEL